MPLRRITAKICAVSELVGDVCKWARGVLVEPIAPDLVPGADLLERRSLAALGGIVAATVGDPPKNWPEPLQHWVRDSPRPPAELSSAFRAAGANADERFAAIYEALVSGPNRRRLGTFFTPRRVVDLMLDRAAQLLPYPALVVDPGAGVGAFSLAARRRWPTATVAGVDVNVVTLGLLGASAHLVRVSQNLQLVHADFLTWISDPTVTTEGSRLFFGNPPYTRHQEMDHKSKEVAREAASGLVDSGLAGLAAYFLAASLRALRSEDGLCFVLPGSWTETRYGRPLREWLWAATRRPVELLAFPPAVEVFPGTRVTAVVLVVGPEAQSAERLAVDHVTVEQPGLVSKRTSDQLREGAAPESFGSLLWPRRSTRPRSSVALGDIARVRRGVATGANHFFFLRDADAAGLPPSLLRPALRRLRHVESDRLDITEHKRIGKAGHPRWLLSLTGPGDVKHAAVKALLKEGKKAGYGERYLTRDRKHWYAVEQIKPPHLLVALMSKDSFRAVLNLKKAIPSNSIYGIYLNQPDDAEALCTWLNSDAGQSAVRACARHYSNGLLKLEPRDYLRVRVPRPDG